MINEIIDYFNARKDEIPELKHFVFGLDEDAIRKAISKFSDYYMFVDLGEFGSDTDTAGRFQDSFVCAVTIAMPVGSRQYSPEEETACVADTFDLISKLRKAMYLGQREKQLKYLSKKHQILPFVAPEMGRSVGWTLMFNITGPDLLGVK